MKKCIVIPDSFKGTISSMEYCAIAAEQIRAHFPACQVVSIPVADGGEGTVDCFVHAVQAQEVTLTVAGPFGEPVEATYARFGTTAVIELAQAAGLPIAKRMQRLDPLAASTYGVGELARHALERGCRRLIFGLGGSCTNDFGCGIACALGVRFLDEAGEAFCPTGGTLARVRRIDASQARKHLASCQVYAMCDIDNPLCGETGAAYVFAPQKGADAATVRLLDGNLRSLATVVQEQLGIDVTQLKGAGAAGGCGAGVVAFLGGTLRSGIDTVLDAIEFDKQARDADVVFTGEGRIDTQSLRGKAVIGIAKRCKPLGVPVVAVVGDIGEGIEPAYDLGVTAIFSINRVAVPKAEAKSRARQDLAATYNDILRFYSACRTEQGERP